MNTGKLLSALVIYGLPFIACFGQTISLNPTSIGPSSYVVTTNSAGSKPSDPTTNNTSQQMWYHWPYNGLTGNVYVSSTDIPGGFSMTIEASSTYYYYVPQPQGPGFTTGSVTVASTKKAIVSNVWWTYSSIMRPLTQSILITDFANLKPGNYNSNVKFSIQQ